MIGNLPRYTQVHVVSRAPLTAKAANASMAWRDDRPPADLPESVHTLSRKKAIPALTGILCECDHVCPLEDEIRRMLVLHDYHLRIRLQSQKILVEPLLQIRSRKVVLVAFRRPVRQKWRVHD